MIKVINTYNHKGGVGKTLISVHLANNLYNKGKKVLLIELDDQASVLTNVGIQGAVQQEINDGHLFPLGVMPLLPNINIESFIYKRDTFDVVVNNELNVLEAGLKPNFFRDLFKKIDDLNTYDFIIIDNPPSKSELVLQGLEESTNILIPFDCEDNSTQAVLDTLTLFVNKGIALTKVQGIIPNKFLHFHKSIHDENIEIVRKAISFEGSTIKLYDKIKNSKMYKEFDRNDEYPELLEEVISDILKDK